MNIKFAILSLALVVLLILGAAIVWYFLFRIKKLNAKLLLKEVREAKESVREGLSELRQDLLEELRLVESSGKQLSPDELARREHILRELDRIGSKIEHEIDDIEEKL